MRDLITPFAHPLVTFWTGLALGIAVATHALLNGAGELAGVRLSPVGIALYLAVLIPVAIWVLSARRKQADQFIADDADDVVGARIPGHGMTDRMTQALSDLQPGVLTALAKMRSTLPPRQGGRVRGVSRRAGGPRSRRELRPRRR